MRILIPEAMHADAVALLRAAGHDVVHRPTLRDEPDELLREAPHADAIIVRNRVTLRGALLRALARCRVIGRLGVGLDHIDLDACRQRGIAVIPASGANARSVAEYTITAALMLLRGSAIWRATEGVAAGAWPRTTPDAGREADGRVFGIVGFGAIGRCTARIAQGLGMSVVATSRRPVHDAPGVRIAPLPEVLAACDVLAVFLPATAETRHLIGAAEIACLRRDAVLVHAGRGGVVDEHALVAALRAGRLAGAAVDVFEQEPLPAGSAYADPPPNLLLTPHVAGVSADSERRVADLVARRVVEALATLATA